MPLEEQLRPKLHSRYRTHGLLGIGGGGDIFNGLGPAKPDPRLPGSPGRTALRNQLIEDGALVPVEVEGVRATRFVLREDVELLVAPPELPPSVVFLSPFDPVWDRGLLGSLFEFDYVWELFFPPEKRRFGWYVLPVLFRDRFGGRIEPRIDREERRVQVVGFWWEDGFAAETRRGLRRCHARRAARLSPVRGRQPSRMGAAPRGREAVVLHSSLNCLGRPRQCPQRDTIP